MQPFTRATHEKITSIHSGNSLFIKTIATISLREFECRFELR